jgi:hypothetical protein
LSEEETMVERICPACQQANPLDDRFCGKCGAPLERQLPVRRSPAGLTIAGRQLPVTWQQLGKTVALSAAALAAEAGLAWLRRRMEVGSAGPAPSMVSPPARAAAPESTALAQAGSVVTIISQRVIEIWDHADGHRQMVERTFWRRIDE